jgi:hypothetical protein
METSGSMPNFLLIIFIIVSLGVIMVIMLETGRRIGKRRMALDPEGSTAGLGVVDAAVFALMGLIIAFTFTGAAARFDTRRQLIVEEANDIGTAYLRVDLLPAEAQPQIRAWFREYLDTRITMYRSIPDMNAVNAAMNKGNELQKKIWDASVNATRGSENTANTILVIQALNDMIDITSTRLGGTRIHPPFAIFGVLGLLALVCSLFAGYGMAGSKTRSWLHFIGFAMILVVVIYVIIDLEYPRIGFIRVTAMDIHLIELKQLMK